MSKYLGRYHIIKGSIASWQCCSFDVMRLEIQQRKLFGTGIIDIIDTSCDFGDLIEME